MLKRPVKYVALYEPLFIKGIGSFGAKIDLENQQDRLAARIKNMYRTEYGLDIYVDGRVMHVPSVGVKACEYSGEWENDAPVSAKPVAVKKTPTAA